MIRNINKRGIALVEYAVMLAFVVTIGSLFTANALPSSIEAVLEKSNNYIGNSSAPKYDIDKEALQYKDALYLALDYLNNAPLLKTEKPLGWVLFKDKGNDAGKLDNFSYYAGDKGNNTSYLKPSNSEKDVFNKGLVKALSSTGYKVVGGSVFYDRNGNVVYNNAKGSQTIGGQGRYNYLAFKNQNTPEIGYIVLCSDNKWRYTATAPSNKGSENF